MEEIKINELSNSEIKIKLVEYENEYEAIKSKIVKHIEKLKELDELYSKCKKELIKRNVL